MGQLYLAIDVGASRLTAGVVTADGAVLVRDRVPTPGRDVWSALARLVRRVIAASPEVPVACGVGCGAPIVSSTGHVSPLAVPSWRGFALRELVEQLTELPVVVDTEGKAFTAGEAWVGAGAGVDDLLGVVVGNGVSGGIVSGGRVLDGRLGNAGNLGHVVVEPDGRPCACGGEGCLDAYCSPTAIEDETGRALQRVNAVVVERTGALVGRAVASVAALVDVRVAVVGGWLATTFGEPFYGALRSELGRRAGLGFTRGLEVRPAQLGNHATLIGAAWLARSALAAGSVTDG